MLRSVRRFLLIDGPIEVSPTVSSTTPTEADRLLRRARSELEATLRGGIERRVEELLAADPVLAADKDAALELVYTEFVIREELGQAPRFDEFHARFPHLRGDLEQLFQVHEALRREALDLGIPVAHRDVPSPGGPRLVGGFEILDEIGRGGMGVVYRARQTRLDRIVALKVILSGVHAGTKERDRFRREVLSAARLDHPNIVRIFEVGDHDGHPYCAMEYVGGGTLADLNEGQPWRPDAAADLVALVARAAQHAHERGIVHRDLKPANILIAPLIGDDVSHEVPGPVEVGPPDGPSRQAICPKIADFGLAKRLSDLEPSPTMTGEVIGTPAYMAPEQASAAVHELGPATDVWALGVILYELLTGRPPFQGDSAAETLQLVRRDEPVAPRAVRSRLPRDLEVICLKCLNKAPAGRYATAAALADDLERWGRGEPILARPVAPPVRALKWMQRHPATAIWLGLLAFVTAAGLGGVALYAVRAEGRRREAEAARQGAQAARDEARAALYFQQVGRAFLEWQASNQDGAEKLLASAARHDKGWEWEYVQGLCQEDLLTLAGHGDQVTCVAYSPDGRILASATGAWEGTKPGELRLWDAQTGRLLHAIATRKGPIRGIAFSPDGKHLATASVAFRSGHPGGVYFWDVATGSEVGTLAGGDENYYSVAFSPDGRRLATAARWGAVRLWDAGTRREVATLRKPAVSGSFSVAFSPDGRRLASGGLDGIVRIWDTDTQAAMTINSGVGDVRSVTFSPDGRHVAAASFNAVVRVWDAATGALVASHGRHDSPTLSVAFTPDGLYLAWAENAGVIHVRDAFDPIGRGHVLRAHSGALNSLAISPDGSRLATGGFGGTVQVRDAWRSQGHRTLSASGVPHATRLAYSPDGSRLATAGVTSDRVGMTSVRDIRIWRVETGAIERTLRGHEQGVTGLAYHPGGTRLASSSLDGTVRLWNAANGHSDATLRGHEGPVLDVAFDRSGERLASVGGDGSLRLWRPGEARALRVVEVDSGPQHAVVFSPDGARLATAGRDGRIRLWDAASLRIVEIRSPHDSAVTRLAFSPDGRRLASGSEGGGTLIWDLATGRLTPLETRHAREVTDLAFSPDGRRLVTASRDWSVKLWDVSTGAEAFSMPARRGEAHSVAFSPDGRQLAAGLHDREVIYLWDVERDRGERLARAAAESIVRHRETARSARAARQWFAARFHLDRLLALQPDDPALFLERADVLAELGEFTPCERDLVRASASPRFGAEAFLDRAVLRLRAADLPGYHEVCRLALERFGGTSKAVVANRVAWTCSLGPDPGAVLPGAVALAERAVADDAGNADYERTLGAVLFRSGRFEEALEHLKASLRLRKNEGSAEDCLLLAMVHERLGEPQDARRWLSSVTSSPSAPPALDASSAGWCRAATLQILQREAEALLGRRP